VTITGGPVSDAHWLPDDSQMKAVDLSMRRDDRNPGNEAVEMASGRIRYVVTGSVVSRIFASWNQLDGWLRQVDCLRLVA
jgi:hypothetical protein